MPKELKEFYVDHATGKVSTEYNDDSTGEFNLADSIVLTESGLTKGGVALTAAEQAGVRGGIGLNLQTIQSQSLVRVGVLGDSTARNQYTSSNSGGLVGTRRDITAFGAWAAVACAKSGGSAYPDVYAFEGYSGQQTHEILASVQGASATEVWGAAETMPIGIRARAPQVTFVTAGTNDMIFAQAADITNGAALARAIAGCRALWNYVRACGSAPIAVSLFPRQGSFTATAGAMSQDSLRPYTAIWNAAIRAEADAAGVPWLDAYTPCAKDDGSWIDGYIYHNGVNDATGIHPSWLASQLIGDAGAAVLNQVINSAPLIPRLELGASPMYSAAFVANDKRQFFANFGDGVLPSTTGWVVRYDPQADGSLGLFTPTIDVAGGGTIRFRKPANTGSRFADFSGPSLAVAAGQEYLWFFDAQLQTVDGFSSLGFAVVDRTSGGGSTFQPLCQFSVSAKESPVGYDSGVVRLALYYKVPAGISSVSPLVTINRSAGGVAAGEDAVFVANIGQVRLS